MKKRVGLLGFGTIGKYIFAHLQKEVEFVFIYDRQQPDAPEAAALYVQDKAGLAEKCAAGVDLVVEVATAGVLTELAPLILSQSDLLAFSVTALAAADFQAQVETLCAQHQKRFYVPHGAILGLDGIFDAKEILESVTITTTKKPKNLGLTNTTREVMYAGPTRGACSKFPRNVNVHAGIALAGLGFDRTVSKIVSDPDAAGNKHEIEVAANGCRFKLEVLSVPGSGVTGAYTPVSACSTIRRILFKQGIVTI